MKGPGKIKKRANAIHMNKKQTFFQDDKGMTIAIIFLAKRTVVIHVVMAGGFS